MCIQATKLEQDLVTWTSTTTWKPYKFNPARLRKTRPPTPTYMGLCDVYPSIQIASLWNTWRLHRIAALTTLLTCIEILELSKGLSTPPLSKLPSEDPEHVQETIRTILDSICASVPFHLGNRTGRCSLPDFSDKTLEFPAYHYFLQDDLGLPDGINRALVMSRDTHNRHVIAQGVWHIINPLSRTLDLFPSPTSADGLASAARQGQRAWMQEQLRRCMVLLGLGKSKPTPEDDMTAQQQILLSNNLRATVAR